MAPRDGPWPDLATPRWLDTCRTLHLWSQLVGKTRLALAPMMNHWWQVPLYVTARGLGTSAVPHDRGCFEVELDLLAHRIELRGSDGARSGFPLGPGTLAGFSARYVEALRAVGVEVSLSPLAVEIPERIDLTRDDARRDYDPAWSSRFFTALVRVRNVLEEFRASFLGKASPVHFFWGSFDLAVSRFSGRRAPRHPGGAPHVKDEVMREAYSHEVSSAGFWAGSPAYPRAAFYSYAYPEPEGFAGARVAPDAAHYDPQLREFVLPYEAVRTAPSPGDALRAFLESTYAAAADLGRWDRGELERPR